MPSDSLSKEIHDEDYIASPLSWYTSTYSTLTPGFWFLCSLHVTYFHFQSENSVLIIISRFHKTALPVYLRV